VDAYCASGACAPKKINGKSCTEGNECTSDICSQKVCCDTTCDAPSDCSNGQCLCNGTACAAGEKCITWYRDAEKDGFGSAASPKNGCESNGPQDGLTYSKNKDDCYDTNPLVKPGQTEYFTTDRGDGSFDYDCNTVGDIQYPNVFGLPCGECGVKIGPVCYKCTEIAGLNTYGFGCNGSNLCAAGGATAGYYANVACGQTGTLYRCGLCNTSKVSQGIVAQGCH
jgi:hypothetical protein